MLVCAEATGNRFLVWNRADTEARDDEQDEGDGREVAERAAEAALAPGLCRALAVDGLLTYARARSGGDLRMVLHNADGGRAEMCGNGLRVLACIWHAGSGDRVRRQQDLPLTIETDVGPCQAWPLPGPDGVARAARVTVGRPRLVATDETLVTPQGQVTAHVVDVGNPHCVVFVADLARVDFARLGPALERHPSFPERSNVEFVERDGDDLRLRVWERGVGETASCGSGVVAAAFVARELHGFRGAQRVLTRGGRLRVSFRDDGVALLDGPVEQRPLDEDERQALLDVSGAAAHLGDGLRAHLPQHSDPTPTSEST